MAKLLGERVRELRTKRSWSQGDLARVVGTEQTAISRIEVRDGYEPGAFLLYRIAKALDTSMDALLDGAVELTLNVPTEDGNAEVSQLRTAVGQLAKNQEAMAGVLLGIQQSLEKLAPAKTGGRSQRKTA